MNEFYQACYDKDITKALSLYKKDYIEIIFNLNFIELLEYININDKIIICLYLNSILPNTYKEETSNYLFNKVKLLKLNEKDTFRLIEYTIIKGKSKQIKETEEILNNNNYNDKKEIRVLYKIFSLYNFISHGLGHNINDINDTFNFIDKYIIIEEDDKEKIEICKSIIYKLIQTNKYSDYKVLNLEKYIETNDKNKISKGTFIDDELIFIIVVPEELLEYTRFLVYGLDEFTPFYYYYLCNPNKILKVAEWLKINKIKLDLKVLYYICIDNVSEDILNFIIQNYTKEEILNNIDSLLNVFNTDNKLNIYCYSQEKNIIKLLDKLIKYVNNDEKIIHYLRLFIETRFEPLPNLYYYLYDLDKNKEIIEYNYANDHYGDIDSFLCSMKNMKQVLKYNKIEKERIEHALYIATENEDVEWIKWLMKTFELTRNTINEYIYENFEKLVKKYNLKM